MIREEVYCDENNLRKYLPARYRALVGKTFYGQTVTLICFPIGRTAITSKNCKKIMKKIKNSNLTLLYFARCFTIEAIKIINESNGEAFSLIDFAWTDDRYHQIQGGTR